ncbi:SGNH/GDSL hydrolase family protein [Streptomyces sp. NPDC023723]|uniref:SGNH/GDSL hydrolase family protein n=1 Tax=Streptomyces sp. NPDC023723 TaxID=3154323 RepID=UPI0033C2888A
MERDLSEPLLHGLLPGLVWSGRHSRLPEAACRKLTADTALAARIPAGVHLAFTGGATVVELTVRVGERTTVPAPTVPEAFVVSLPDGSRSSLAVPAGGGRVRIELPGRDPGQPVRVHLPESVEVFIDAITADAPLVPVPRGPRWVVYGDSITQGWSVTEPGLAWPSRVADTLGLDLVNLGFAGAARGELPVADVIAQSGAEAVALAWGTNAWTSLPTGTAQMAETTRLFLTAVRQGLPDAPVVVISPIVRPDGEHRANRFGATLAELRDAQESAVLAFAVATGDPGITLVPGRDLVPAGELVDGIHPGDEGQRRLADAVVSQVAAGLGLVARGGAR